MPEFHAKRSYNSIQRGVIWKKIAEFGKKIKFGQNVLETVMKESKIMQIILIISQNVTIQQSSVFI